MLGEILALSNLGGHPLGSLGILYDLIIIGDQWDFNRDFNRDYMVNHR